MSTTSSELCSFCKGINVNSLVTFSSYDGFNDHLNQFGYEHQPSHNALVRSAETCPLCSLFLFAIESKNVGAELSPSQTDSDQSPVFLLARDGEVFYRMATPKEHSTLKIIGRVDDRGLTKTGDLSIATFPDDPLALSNDIAGRPQHYSEKSPNADFDRLRSWYRTCSEQHPKDRGLAINTLPTRVIDVGIGEPYHQPRLLETTDAQRTPAVLTGSYFALTYCRGPSRAFTTLKKTYQDRLKGFSVDDLPTTIQDALIVTRELGVRWLWVDPICIIQDDSAEYENETAEMAEIYANATITISAEAAHDTNVGCFLEKWSVPRPSIALRSKCSDLYRNEEGTMYISANIDSVEQVLDRFVLNSRGWDLQGRIVPREIIHIAQSGASAVSETEAVSRGRRHDTEPKTLSETVLTLRF